MFKPERPIESEEEDFLWRKVFSNDLWKALLNWKEDESLVLGIYGKWGSWKTSIINLAKKYIKSSSKDNKPTIIEFNPWAFSDSNNLGNNFFLELAKQLDMKGFGEKDKEIANKLAYYWAILNFVPSEVTIPGFVNVVLAVFTVISFSVPFWFANIVIDFIWYIFGAILLLVNLSKGILWSFINLFEKRSVYKQKSITQLKEEIKQELASRDRKLLIVIDDIDRLNKSEIHEIFRLVRVNADFPNTIYLLSFDREIIEANLEESPWISWKDYLEKIVQVNLDVPYVNKNKIDKFLFKELDRILEWLPKKALTFFGNDSHWSNVYHSGLWDFFRNVRDVKRFINGLEFNITLINNGGVLEVNPIDFIAIEAIRLFVPEFYSFMRSRKNIFTMNDKELEYVGSGKDFRKLEIENGLSRCSDDYRESTRKLIKQLFPYVDNSLKGQNVSYDYGWQKTWGKQLKICAIKNFDSYFTGISWGDEEELSQLEIEKILESTKSKSKFEKVDTLSTKKHSV